MQVGPEIAERLSLPQTSYCEDFRIENDRIVARRVIEAAEAVNDQASVDLGTRRLDVHEKNAWMLRVHLE